MKKVLILLVLSITIVLASSFTSCSNSSGGSGGSSAGNNNSPDTAITNDIYTSDIDTPLTLEAINSTCTITIENPWSTLKYQINNGPVTNVTNVTNTKVSLSINAHQKVSFFAERSENRIEMERSIPIPIYMTIQCNTDCYVYGNIMSLLNPEDYNSATTLLRANSNSKTFAELFSGNTHIKNHNTKELVLPAQTLTEACYSGMFSGCTGLTQAPSLPAETLENSCYFKMFSECTNLTQAPSLPATTLQNVCYNSMFKGCTKLTQAPVLPATTLADNCYYKMFNGCTSLKSLTCLATNISAYNCTTNWLENVSSPGVFYKNSSMNSWEKQNVSSVPTFWGITNYRSPQNN